MNLIKPLNSLIKVGALLATASMLVGHSGGDVLDFGWAPAEKCGDTSLSEHSDYCIQGDAAAEKLAALQGVTSINSDLVITGTSLTELSALAELEEIGGRLIIESNDALSSLNGLNALANLYSLKIDSNLQLSSLSGLERLSGNLDSLFIADSPINSLLPLSQLTEVYNLRLENIPVADLQGLEQLNVINGLYLDLPQAETLNQFSSGEILRDLELHIYPSTLAQPDFSRLAQVSNYFSLIGHGDVNNQSPAPSIPVLTSVGGELYLNNLQNTELPSFASLQQIGFLNIDAPISDLSNLSGPSINRHLSIENTLLSQLPELYFSSDANDISISIEGNSELINLNGLNASFLSSISIRNNNKLASIEALGQQTELEIVSLENNPLLSQLDIFQAISELDSLNINNIPLENLNIFATLQQLTYLEVRNNPNLTSLGLDSLSLSDHLNIVDNPKLCLQRIYSLLTQLDKQISDDGVIVMGNGTDIGEGCQ